MEPWGGLIETPTSTSWRPGADLHQLAHHRAVLTDAGRRCLTGRNHTTNGMACIAEATSELPQRQRPHPLRMRHHRRGAGRAWLEHLHARQVAPGRGGRDEHGLDQAQLAGRPRLRALLRFLGGETNQWYPDLIYDNHLVEQPAMPEDGYHLTTDLTDKAIEFIKDAKMIVPDKPFFMYFCPGATPPPPRPQGVDRPLPGPLRHGYERYRERCSSASRLGIFPEDAELSPLNLRAGGGERRRQAVECGGRGAALGLALEEEQRLFCRMAEVYAGSCPSPTTRSGACSTSWRRPGAGEHHRDAGLRQRRQRRGRPQRVGE